MPGLNEALKRRIKCSEYVCFNTFPKQMPRNSYAKMRRSASWRIRTIESVWNSSRIERIFASAEKIDQKTMTLQYFEMLKALGAGPSTKYIFPLEFTSLIENFRKGG